MHGTALPLKIVLLLNQSRKDDKNTPRSVDGINFQLQKFFSPTKMYSMSDTELTEEIICIHISFIQVQCVSRFLKLFPNTLIPLLY